MKTIIQGNAERAKEYKYFECSKCGWIGKAEKGEYEYHSDQYQGDWCRVKCPTCHNVVYSIEKIDKIAEIKALEKSQKEKFYWQEAKA